MFSLTTKVPTTKLQKIQDVCETLHSQLQTSITLAKQDGEFSWILFQSELEDNLSQAKVSEALYLIVNDEQTKAFDSDIKCTLEMWTTIMLTFS